MSLTLPWVLLFCWLTLPFVSYYSLKLGTMGYVIGMQQACDRLFASSTRKALQDGESEGTPRA